MNFNNELTELFNNFLQKQDYNVFLNNIEQLNLLKETPQDLYYHGEGDVWTHTKMVCDSLLKDIDFQKDSKENQFIMFYSALLHDIAKPLCTKEESGKITSAGHSKAGAVDVRLLLWKYQVPFFIRESIVNIVKYHQIPFFAFNNKTLEGQKEKTAEFLAHQLSMQLPLNLLITVAKADMNGRIYIDKQKSLDDIEIFKELCLEENCLYQAKNFPNVETKMEYFKGMGSISPNYAFYKELKSNVIVLSGLPATGKNTWIDNNKPDLPVISFDDAKEELGLSHNDNPGLAVSLAKEKAKELLREGKDFIWNATHLSKQMRDKTIDLCYNYNAKINIVYLENNLNTIKERNSQRNTSLTNKKIEDMLYKWDVPTQMESHTIEYIPKHGEKLNKNKLRK